MIERRNDQFLHFGLFASAEVPCKRKIGLARFIRCFVFLGFGRIASFIGKLSWKMADVHAKSGIRERSPGPHAVFRRTASWSPVDYPTKIGSIGVQNI